VLNSCKVVNAVLLPDLGFRASVLLFLVVASASHASPAGPPAVTVPAAIERAEKEAGQWLLGQMVPNESVPVPDPDRRRLLLSYRVPHDDPAYRFTYGRSFIYDDALGAIAFTMLGRYREAEFLLNALRHLQRPDGSLWFAYNTQNGWPGTGDAAGAMIRTGSVAWVGYAFTYYVSIRARENPGFPSHDPLAIEYLGAARSIASFLLENRVSDPGDPRYGLVTGGSGASTVTIGQASGRPSEVYDAQKVRWVSMEHNIDAWFFLKELTRLAPDAKLAEAAELIRTRLAALWSDKEGQFFQGIREDKSLDASLPLDGASWGALFLLAQDRGSQARTCVQSMRGRFGSEADGLSGYRPYGAEPVYDDAQVNRFFFPEAPGKLWKDLPFVWGEGSLGAAVALARTGDREEAVKLADSVRQMSLDGGVRYASTSVPYLFSDYPSVASTSWYVICVETLRGNPAADAFWGP
jgi:hypothetical protein